MHPSIPTIHPWNGTKKEKKKNRSSKDVEAFGSVHGDVRDRSLGNLSGRSLGILDKGTYFVMVRCCMKNTSLREREREKTYHERDVSPPTVDDRERG